MSWILPSENKSVMFFYVYGHDGNCWRDTTLRRFKRSSNAAVGQVNLLTIARHAFPDLAAKERQK